MNKKLAKLTLKCVYIIHVVNLKPLPIYFGSPEYKRETRETDSEMCIRNSRNKSETITIIF